MNAAAAWLQRVFLAFSEVVFEQLVGEEHAAVARAQSTDEPFCVPSARATVIRAKAAKAANFRLFRNSAIIKLMPLGFFSQLDFMKNWAFFSVFD